MITIHEAEVPQFELLQLAAFYQAAPAPLRSLAWDLLQTKPTPRNTPLLLAFALANTLVEGAECQEYHQAHGTGEPMPTQEKIIASFWSVYPDFSGGCFSPVTDHQREAITSAARGLFALGEAKEGKDLKRIREIDDTEEHLSRV